MQWILVIGLHLNANTAMGAFETEADCWKAADQLVELLEGQPLITTCVKKGDPYEALIKH